MVRPQLTSGFLRTFELLDKHTSELRRDRSLAKLAQAVTLYHLIVGGDVRPARPGGDRGLPRAARGDARPSARACGTWRRTSSATSASASSCCATSPRWIRTCPPRWWTCCGRFDAVREGIDHRRAPREPVVLQWEFTDAEPWHVRVENGSTRAAPGRVERADVAYAARCEDFVDVFAGRLDRRRALATRRLRPRGSPSALWRTRRLFS